MFFYTLPLAAPVAASHGARMPASRRSFLNYIGVAILIIGMASAEFIYWRGLQNPSTPADADSPYNSKLYEQTLERTDGIFGVIMDGWSRSIAKLHEPRPLAITITVFSMLTSATCFLTASRMPRD
jgi:hypothetical protein